MDSNLGMGFLYYPLSWICGISRSWVGNLFFYFVVLKFMFHWVIEVLISQGFCLWTLHFWGCYLKCFELSYNTWCCMFWFERPLINCEYRNWFPTDFRHSQLNSHVRINLRYWFDKIFDWLGSCCWDKNFCLSTKTFI